MVCSFSGTITTMTVATIEAPGIADAAEQQDRDEDQRVGEGVVVRRDEAADHAEQRAGDADQEIADHEGGDLPARDVEAEAACRGLVEPQRVEIEPDPGALQPPHQHERADAAASRLMTK